MKCGCMSGRDILRMNGVANMHSVLVLQCILSKLLDVPGLRVAIRALDGRTMPELNDSISLVDLVVPVAYLSYVNCVRWKMNSLQDSETSRG